MNPTGKVFTADELAFIAGLLAAHDAYAVCDEVYEHLVFAAGAPHSADDAARHGRALPAHRQRRQDVFADRLEGRLCQRAARAASHLVAKAHQNLTFTTPPNLQRAVAYGLAKPDAYFAAWPATWRRGAT